MKAYYLKLSIGVVFILCFFTSLIVCRTEVVWFDDFNDGKLEDWIIRGNWSCKNKYAQAFLDTELPDTSNMYNDSRLRYSSQIAYGTWSFDLYLQENKYILISFLANGTEWIDLNDYYFEIKPTKQNSGFYLGRHINDQYRLLTQKTILQNLTNRWTHIDITKDKSGRIYVYKDRDLVLRTLNNENRVSEWFGIYSDPDGTYIDNITVSNTVDVTHQAQLEVIPEYDGETVTQGELVDLQLLVRDDVKFPIENADVNVQVGDQSFTFSEIGDGVYQASIDTSSFEESFEVTISAEKEGFLSSTTTEVLTIKSPAEFIVQNLFIEPRIVEVDEIITISIDISNVGESSGIYLLVLEIDDTMIEEYNVELESDDSKTVIFEYYSTESGIFTVTVDELSDEVEVKQPVEEEPQEIVTGTDQRGAIPSFPVISILAALIIYYFIRKWVM